MSIDKAQRYDAAVAGLRDLIGRARDVAHHLDREVIEKQERAQAMRESAEAAQRLLDELLREPPEPAHIEEAPGPRCARCRGRMDSPAAPQHCDKGEGCAFKVKHGTT